MSRRWATVVACRPSSSSWRTVSRRFAWTGRIAVAGSGRLTGNAWAFEVVSTAAAASRPAAAVRVAVRVFIVLLLCCGRRAADHSTVRFPHPDPHRKNCLS